MSRWRRVEDFDPPIDGTPIMGFGQTYWAGYRPSGPKHQAVVRAEVDYGHEDYGEVTPDPMRFQVITHCPETVIMVMTHWKHLGPDPE